MSAYNSVNGLPATQNPWLLTTKLRTDWGFRGVAISDAAATGGATVLHFTEPDTPSAAQHAWEAGLDVVFQSSWPQHRPYLAAVTRRMVAPAVIDSAVARVLRLKLALGLFESPYGDPERAASVAGNAEHLALAREAAVASTVLLKNDARALPLSPTTPSIALIGTDAVEARLGGYSGPGTRRVSILDGIRAAAPRIRVGYAPGPGRSAAGWVPVPAAQLSSDGKSGLKGQYWRSQTFEGSGILIRQDPQVDFAWTLSAPDTGFTTDRFAVRWTGTLTAPPGLTRLGVEGDDGYRLWIDDSLVIDRWRVITHRATLVPVRFAAGSKHRIRLEFHTGVPNARIRLIWDAGVDRGQQARIDSAVALARRSSVAVIVAGIEEGEFRDRAHLGLPGSQEALIRAIAATGKPTIVVLVAGSAVTMPWLDQVDAVLDVWYPGQEGGSAVADILFGRADPGGRLPITFPISEGQLPLRYDHRPTGRGDDYLDSTGEPLFPFGFGLSYAEFRYEGIALSHPTIDADGTTTVTCTITNTGARAGSEVVQLYLRDELASTTRPVMRLRGFQRVTIEPGKSTTVSFTLTRADFEIFVEGRGWLVEPGTFRVMIGASARDIRLHTDLTVR